MADGDDPIRPRPPLASDSGQSIPLADGDDPTAEDDDPIPPRPRAAPAVGQPIPRLWKAEPETDDEAKPARKSRRERLAEEKEAAAKADGKGAPKAKKGAGPGKGKPARGSDPKEPKRVLLEETPESETYEARQRVRILIGTGFFVIIGLGIALLLRKLNNNDLLPPTGPDEGASMVTASGSVASKKAADLDLEARNLLGTAQQLAKVGNTDGAIAVLNRIIKTYPKTAVANEAQAALDRPKQNLPLFLDRPTVVAAPGEGTATPAPAPAVVRAEPVRAAAGTPGVAADVQLHLPPNAAEAPRTAPAKTDAPAAVAALPLPTGFRPVTEAGVHPSGWRNQIVSDRDGGVMVLVPAGTFLQGRNDGPPAEGPEHKVALGAFYIDQHETTVGQYALYLRETGGKAPPRSSPTAKGEERPAEPNNDLPVVNVTAREASAYCKWAGKTLPTEAQWEAAARTTDGRPSPWGSGPPAWKRPREPRQIDPVMSFDQDQSPYGAFDLAGNAEEYTKDFYDPAYYQRFRGQVATNPLGPDPARGRPLQVVVKGGSRTWLAAWRDGLKVDGRFPYVGFRGVLSVDTPAAQPAAPNGNGPPIQAGGIVPF